MNKQNKKLPHYVIGTRGSLLALTQCLQMKAQLEESKEATFSLKIIKTEGDENTSAPLWALDGKDFFTKELDQALLAGEVDLVVHSYKDLGSERPEGITLATITERKFAHDILFIRKEVREALKEKKVKKLLVGTSSPRRMENISEHLRSYLPFGEELGIEVETKSLRGNVNTRLEKCVRGDYDAIVLALPGIERLATGLKTEKNEAYERHGNPIEILKELIKELDYMILPLGEFPAAASQGALAIECLEQRDDGGKLLEILKSFNHQKTIDEVSEERRLFQTFGGGCHLAVGINVSTGSTGETTLLRRSLAGAVDNKKIKQLDLLRTEKLSPIKGKAFIGLPKVDSFDDAIGDQITKKITNKLTNKVELSPSICDETYSDILVTSPSVVDMASDLFKNVNNLNVKWWASGTKTMKKMAAKGLWVHGSSDSLGEEHLKELRQSSLLTLFSSHKKWGSLSHPQATSLIGDVLPIYEKEYLKGSDDYHGQITECSFYYWTSSTQYKHFNENYKLNPTAVHACGIGKTFQALKELGVNPTPVASMRELKDWLSK
jgi:hydroxymethylbilane synthase